MLMGSSDKGRQTNYSILILECAQPWRFGNRDGRRDLNKVDGFFGTHNTFPRVYIPSGVLRQNCLVPTSVGICSVQGIMTP